MASYVQHLLVIDLKFTYFKTLKLKNTFGTDAQIELYIILFLPRGATLAGTQGLGIFCQYFVNHAVYRS